MPHLDESETRIEELQLRLKQVEWELQISQRQIAQILETVQTQQQELRSQQTAISRVDRIQMEMLTSRVWRTLRGASTWIKKVVPGRRRRAGDESVALSAKQSFLVCDEPKSTDNTPRSGIVTVRGWCLAEGGVDSVQIEIPGQPVAAVKPNVSRPDVKKAHPELDITGRAGFAYELDSSVLPNGQHTIAIRILAGGEMLREVRTSVHIDHEKGFASDYDRWIYHFELPDNHFISLKLPTLKKRPLISIVMPVFNTDPAELTAAIQSVLEQSYENWELCIADDCSTRPEPRPILQQFAAGDNRIKLIFRTERGGISKACNTAWQMASGEYVAFLDHDDTLAPHALAYVCEALAQNPDADLIYSDEDKIDRKGRRFEPFFKPDWSPDLLLSENYICHLLVLKQELARSIGGFNSDCDGSQDYDLILKVTGKANEILHIPRVLYHWRAGTASTAASIGNKQYALDAAHRALEQYCKSKHPEVQVQKGRVLGRWRIRYPISENARVSIIIASGGKTGILQTNLEGLFAKTSYRNFETVIIDNSKGDAISSLVKKFQSSATPIRYIDHRYQPFNYSVINNLAARQCESPILLFLNDDTSVIAEDWLTSMVELVERPEVGVVGAKLLYPDRKIQHAGVVMGLYDNCGHAFKALDGDVSHYFDFSDVIRNVSAVTGACLMTKRGIFWEVGGFDEVDFAVAFNDIDLCLKIGSLGYRVLYTPHALLYHHEAFSKTSKDLIPHPREVERMREKWTGVIEKDPFYSPNLTRNDEDYSLRQ
jgi:O-antigen biosynthesis protein